MNLKGTNKMTPQELNRNLKYAQEVSKIFGINRDNIKYVNNPFDDYPHKDCLEIDKFTIAPVKGPFDRTEFNLSVGVYYPGSIESGEPPDYDIQDIANFGNFNAALKRFAEMMLQDRINNAIETMIDDELEECEKLNDEENYEALKNY